MVPLHFWLLGRRQHLQLSLTSLLPEEWEAFPELISESVQRDADRSPDWHSYRHCLAFHTLDRARAAHQEYILLLLCPPHTEPPGYGNTRILDWYCGD